MLRVRLGMSMWGSEEKYVVGVDGKLVAMGIEMVDSSPEVVFSAFPCWGGTKRRFWEEEVFAPPPRAKARGGKYETSILTGATSHMCQVHCPQPGPRAHPHGVLPMSPSAASESFAPASYYAPGDQPWLPHRKTVSVWLQVLR